ncbi:phytanoyl-CoA dioxygenase domain-containing protein 1 homolog [Amphiura filiformis]|uniref:phytanoyl-CoA dioxygenase domain-containing protein 1 homolog n=1 Tax=Amphiura filiformis TaxID=82378 RepID=UPI003B210FB1
MTEFEIRDEPSEYKPGIIDWSTLHKPSGTLFDPIKNASEWGKFKLSEEQVAQFWRDGFITNVPVLSEQQCDKILQDYQKMADENTSYEGIEMMYEWHSNQSGDPDNVLLHALGHWRLTALFHDLVFLPSIAAAASQLLVKGRETKVRFWHDQMFAKPPRHGGVVAWHQDYSYWTRTQPMQHLTIHVAVDAQTLENGGLHYIPGSHRWTRNGNPLPVTDFNFKDMESIKTILTDEELAEFKPVPSLLKKGEASFHHPLAVHGSWGNRSEHPRRACVVNYFADGTVSNDNEPLLKGLPAYKKGEKLVGQFFPVVYDPAWTKA